MGRTSSSSFLASALFHFFLITFGLIGLVLVALMVDAKETGEAVLAAALNLLFGLGPVTAMLLIRDRLRKKRAAEVAETQRRQHAEEAAIHAERVRAEEQARMARDAEAEQRAIAAQERAAAEREQFDRRLAAERKVREEAEAAQAEEFLVKGQLDRADELLGRLRVAKGPAARRAILRQGLQEITRGNIQRRFVRDAAGIEVKAAHEKAARLVNGPAKLRVYQAALTEMKSDDVPDDFQAEAIAELERAVRELGG